MVEITLDFVQTPLKSPAVCSRQWILMKSCDSCHLKAEFVNHVTYFHQQVLQEQNPFHSTHVSTVHEIAAQLAGKFYNLNEVTIN